MYDMHRIRLELAYVYSLQPSLIEEDYGLFPRPLVEIGRGTER